MRRLFLVAVKILVEYSARSSGMPERGPEARLSGDQRLMKTQFVVVTLLLVAAFGTPTHAADVQRGKALYETRCTSCHSIEYPGAGPAHKGLFGRKAGSAPGFGYSSALKDSKIVWSEETVDKWLSGPEAFIPGQKMWVAVADATERADIIAYLAQATRR